MHSTLHYYRTVCAVLASVIVRSLSLLFVFRFTSLTVTPGYRTANCAMTVDWFIEQYSKGRGLPLMEELI
jgi:hypothetical protein